MRNLLALFHDFHAEILRSGSSCNAGIEFLSTPLLGSDYYFAEFFSKKVDKVLKAQELLVDLNNPQVEIQLLRSCQSICKLNHLIRTGLSHMVSDQLSRFDLGMQRSLCYITRSSISNLAWMQASLPIRLGGLGLRSAQSSAAAAFVGSSNANRQLVNQLLSYSSKSLSSGLDNASSTSTVDMVEFRKRL